MTSAKRAAVRKEWRGWIEQWQASEESGLGFCRERGLSYHRFVYWKRKLLEAKGAGRRRRGTEASEAVANETTASGAGAPASAPGEGKESGTGTREAPRESRSGTNGGRNGRSASADLPVSSPVADFVPLAFESESAEPRASAGIRLRLGDGIEVALDRDFDASALCRGVSALGGPSC